MGPEQLEARRLLAVVINEFHYDSGSPLELTEFVELHNTGAELVDLSGWRLDRGVDYTFPAGSAIAAGGYLVVAQSAEHFQTRFGLAAGGYNTGLISATVATAGSAAVATAPSAAATDITIPYPTLASTSSFRQLAFRQLALALAAAQGDEDD